MTEVDDDPVAVFRRWTSATDGYLREILAYVGGDDERGAPDGGLDDDDAAARLGRYLLDSFLVCRTAHYSPGVDPAPIRRVRRIVVDWVSRRAVPHRGDPDAEPLGESASLAVNEAEAAMKAVVAVMTSLIEEAAQAGPIRDDH